MLSMFEKDNPEINDINPFNSFIDCSVINPIKLLTAGILEKDINAISINKIMVDRGTDTRLLIKNKTGN